MPEMLSQEKMDKLKSATGSEFEQMWLHMMVRHHRGAIAMTKSEVKAGKCADAVELAKSIVTSQAGEIDRIEAADRLPTGH